MKETKMINIKVDDICVGIHYERPDGTIVKTFSCNTMTKLVGWRDDDTHEGEVSFDEFRNWKARRDLKDFPNAKDPILPYDFDLIFDLKYTSQLKQVLKNDPDPGIVEMALEFGYITAAWIPGEELDGETPGVIQKRVDSWIRKE